MSDIKRILFLSRRDDRPDYDTADSMQARLAEAASGIEYTACFLQELSFVYDGSELRITNLRDGSDLREYDGIFLLAWFKERVHEESALTVSLYAEAYGVKVLNTEARHTRSRSKLSQCVAAALNGVAVTPFVVVPDNDGLAEAVATSGITYPMIVKSITGSRGNANYLVHDSGELAAAIANQPEKTYVVQPFIPNDGDYRVLVMGGRVRLVIHRQARTGSHLNNTSKGGSAQVIDQASLPPAMLDECVRISRLLKREVTGVDMIIDNRTGDYHFLEVNNMPQLSTGSMTGEKAAALDEFFMEWLQA